MYRLIDVSDWHLYIIAQVDNKMSFLWLLDLEQNYEKNTQ